MEITGIVLAGGQCSRMGQDKALVKIGGKRLIEHSLAVLGQFCDSILISTHNPALGNWGYRIVADEYHGIGPIAGLYSALIASQSRHTLVIPCDTPYVDAVVYERLLDSADDCLAVIAGTVDGLKEPLIGYYDRSVAEILRQQIQEGDYKLQHALERMDARIEVFSDTKRFVNINAPSDLHSCLSAAYEGHHGESSELSIQEVGIESIL
ncbi:MAG: molybdenum cofactor guanylyltransferase [Candidatus Aminicenantaceae bacterium]